MEHIEMLEEILKDRKTIFMKIVDENSVGGHVAMCLITIRREESGGKLPVARASDGKLPDAIEKVYKTTFPAPTTTFGRLKHLITLKEAGEEVSQDFKDAVTAEYNRVAPKSE